MLPAEKWNFGAGKFHLSAGITGMQTDITYYK